MREIHFFESEEDEKDWVMDPFVLDLPDPIWVMNDYALMSSVLKNVPQESRGIVIATIQMCYLDTRWFEKGFRIFVHDHTGTFEIVLGEGNERTDREIRYANSLYNLWLGGEFGSKEKEE